MNAIATKLPGVMIFEPRIFRDERGHFLETFHERRYREAGLAVTFVQDNVSFSKRHVLRGLHLQHPNDQGKLVSVLAGEVLDVAVDVRVGSPTFGESVNVVLSSETGRQLFIPEGFAHGFCVTSDTALVGYKCTRLYDAGSELGVLWRDPDLGIDWPTAAPLLSDKDAVYPRLKDIDPKRLPAFAAR